MSGDQLKRWLATNGLCAKMNAKGKGRESMQNCETAARMRRGQSPFSSCALWLWVYVRSRRRIKIYGRDPIPLKLRLNPASRDPIR